MIGGRAVWAYALTLRVLLCPREPSPFFLLARRPSRRARSLHVDIPPHTDALPSAHTLSRRAPHQTLNMPHPQAHATLL